jgi:hypothetical protein
VVTRSVSEGEIRFRGAISKLKGLEERLKDGGHVDQDRVIESERGGGRDDGHDLQSTRRKT